MKVGDKVKIKWEKSGYCKSSDYSEYGVIINVINYCDPIRYEVDSFDEDKNYSLSFTENELELVKEFKVGDRVKIWKNPETNVEWNSWGSMDYLDGKTVTIEKIDSSFMGHACIVIGRWCVSFDCLERVEEVSDYEKATIAQNSYQEDCEEVADEQEECANLYEEILNYTYTLPSYTPPLFGCGINLATGDMTIRGTLINKDKKMNTSIIEFAKNLTLTKEEKLLRKAGLKDDDGDWTPEAMEIVKNKKAKEMGFKNFEELATNVGSGTISAIEFVQMFQKYEADLIKIAVEFEKENKKK